MKTEQLRGLYAITDPKLCEHNLVVKIEQAISGGAQVIQYRNKHASKQQKLKEASTINALCEKRQCLFIINDDVELAKQVNASGVHIGQSDASIQQAREMLGDQKFIGVSCNNQLQWAIEAQQAGADYVAFGRFFSSYTKPEAPQADIALLHQAKQQLTIPIVAIGGITADNASVLIDAGAHMLAVIHAVFAQQDITAAAKAIQQQFP